YKRDYLHDHLLAASRAFHKCLPGLDHEPRPKISGARRRKAGALLLTVCFVRGVWRRAAFIRPQVRGGEVRRVRPVAAISAEDVASPKSICEWAKSGQGRTLRTDSFASAQAPCSTTSLQPGLVRRMTY